MNFVNLMKIVNIFVHKLIVLIYLKIQLLLIIIKLYVLMIVLLKRMEYVK